MILIRISAEGEDQQVCDAILERLSDEALLVAVIKRQAIQVQTTWIPAPVQEKAGNLGTLDGMTLG